MAEQEAGRGERRREELPLHDGRITTPEGCPRGRNDCAPLSRIASEDYGTFMCCGENDGSHAGPEQDKWRLCIKGQTRHGVDILVNFDERDMIDTSAVLLNGLSYIAVGRVDADGTPTPEADDEPSE